MSDADVRDGEGYWAHAHWTLLDGKKDNEVGGQTLGVAASMCHSGVDISSGHMCASAQGEWVQPDVNKNKDAREQNSWRKALIYTHGC